MLIDFRYPYLLMRLTDAREAAAVDLIPEVRLSSPTDRYVWFARTESVLAHLQRMRVTLSYASPEAATRFAEAARTAFLLDAKLNAGAVPGAPAFSFADYATLVRPPFRLREYQARAAHHLIYQPGGVLLGDAMGLGKTVTSLVAAHRMAYLDPGPSRVVVVCPSGLCRQWRGEILAALAIPGQDEAAYAPTDVVVYAGPPKARRALLKLRSRFLVVPYELLIRDYDDLAPCIVAGTDGSRRAPRVVILDEAGRVKNPASKTWETLRRLTTDTTPGRVFALNGTPVENFLQDAWAQHALTAPDAFPSFASFEQAHVVKVMRRGANGMRYEKIVGYRGLDDYNRYVRGVRVRRDYADVEEQLPTAVVVTEGVDLDPLQRRRYEEIKASDELAGDAKLTALVRAATLATDENGKVVSTKLERLMVVIADEPGQVVALCNSRTFVREASRRLADLGVAAAVIEGDTDDARRQGIVAAFRAGGLRVLLGTSAAERGLNLQVAALLVSVDLPWNPGAWHQRVGRIRRIGSPHASVRVLNLVANDTVEEYVADVVYKKQSLFDLVAGAETDVKPVATPDVRKLLKGA
jgi:SNF2 family DNA or RNA helicase